MEPDLSDEAVEELFRKAWNASVAKAPTQHSKRTASCPSLPRFAAALRTGWQADEQAHIANCSYCQSTWRSAQKIAAEPKVDDIESPADLVNASPQMREYRVRADFSMAAGASCSSQVDDVFERQLDGGFRLRLFPKPGQPELMTLAIDGRQPSGAVQVLVGGKPLELLQPFDEFGYTTVLKCDVQALLDGNAQPSLLDLPSE